VKSDRENNMLTSHTIQAPDFKWVFLFRPLPYIQTCPPMKPSSSMTFADGVHGHLVATSCQSCGTREANFPPLRALRLKYKCPREMEMSSILLYQMEHLFSLHDTPVEDHVEFCVFYLKDEASVWWRWMQKQERYLYHGYSFMRK